MTVHEERMWRALCDQAMSELDVNKLLTIFLKMNHDEERKASKYALRNAPRFPGKAFLRYRHSPVD
jgi:hypothetical protein